MKQDPTQWFDQFLPAPDGWEHPQWCWRHWAPCPAFGANGLIAALEVSLSFLSTAPGGLKAEELNERMQNAGKLCCQLGDEYMYELWGKCGPETVGSEVNG